MCPLSNVSVCLSNLRGNRNLAIHMTLHTSGNDASHQNDVVTTNNFLKVLLGLGLVSLLSTRTSTSTSLPIECGLQFLNLVV